MTKLRIKVHAGPQSRDHLLELHLPADPAKINQGRLQFVLDAGSGEIDWAEISPGVYSILADGRSYQAHVSKPAGDSAARSSSYLVAVSGRDFLLEVWDPRRSRYAGAEASAEGPQEILAPMPGRIVKVLVSEDQQVGRGDGLLVIEAMKMQNELRAPRSGRVAKLYVLEGEGVESGFKLLRLV